MKNKICKNCKHWGRYSDGTLAKKEFDSAYNSIVSNCEIIGKMGHPATMVENAECFEKLVGENTFEPLKIK